MCSNPKLSDDAALLRKTAPHPKAGGARPDHRLVDAALGAGRAVEGRVTIADVAARVRARSQQQAIDARQRTRPPGAGRQVVGTARLAIDTTVLEVVEPDLERARGDPEEIRRAFRALGKGATDAPLAPARLRAEQLPGGVVAFEREAIVAASAARVLLVRDEVAPAGAACDRRLRSVGGKRRAMAPGDEVA